MERYTIICSICNVSLWSCFTLSSGDPVIWPVNSSVPVYNPKNTNCPECGQKVHIQNLGPAKFVIKDEVTGQIRVA